MDGESDPLERAGRRLAQALDALEGAVARRQDSGRTALALQAEVQSLSEDRSRLAQALDQAEARCARLEAAAGHATQRVDAAMDAIRELLDDDEA